MFGEKGGRGSYFFGLLRCGGGGAWLGEVGLGCRERRGECLVGCTVWVQVVGSGGLVESGRCSLNQSDLWLLGRIARHLSVVP